MRAVIVGFLLLMLPVAIQANDQRLAFIYYYAWYGSQPVDGSWIHWQENNHTPPKDISSSFYPKLGPYSSKDLAVIDQHMRWIAGANINALIYSWWGQNDFTDQAARSILDAAADYGLKVCFMIEPYLGRTMRSICADIDFLTRKYGNHPAFLRIARSTAYSQNESPRPVFFIYQPDFPSSEIREVTDAIHASDRDAILLLQSTDADWVEQTHVDGLFAYEAFQNVMHFYKVIAQALRERHVLFVPCVSPGFNENRTLGARNPVFRPRNNGRNYDEWWTETLAADPKFVAIISFNEWHEGTQIEPAIPFGNPTTASYLNYGHPYGTQGSRGEESYLRRTATWIDLFQQLAP